MKKVYLTILFFITMSELFSQNYTVLGNATSVAPTPPACNCFRLTPDLENQAGAIFQNQTINLNNSFDFSFRVFLGCGGSGGADGIVFVLTSNPNGLGNPGEGLGYAGGNQPFSIGVEFDTWQNGNAGDPSFDHIGIESRGQYNHNLGGPVEATPGSNIDNCAWHTVRIVWDVNSNTYSVYFDGNLRQQIVIPNMVATHFGGNPIVNWGWSGATGGGTNDQQVCVVNTSSWVSGVNYQSCDLTMQFSDISTSNLGSVQSWSWNFGDGTTSNLQNPVHTYAALGTYTVSLTITDISGCPNTYTHDVTFNSPIVITPNIVSPPCNGGTNGRIEGSASGGFGPAAGYGGYMFLWSDNTTQPTLMGAGAGTYTLTVTDGVCTTNATYTVTQPTAVSATTSHTDASCNTNNGTATINITGGTPPYLNVNWGPSFPGNVATGLAPGTFIADFTDANGCSALVQYRETILALPCGITSTNLTTTNVTCFGGNNGSATLTVTGGSGGSVAGWNTVGGGVFTINGLAAGTYSYSYSDANPALNFGGTFNINQTGAIVASIATVNMSCSNSGDGQALASIDSGGTAPFNYAWSGGQPNSPSATNLGPGPISVNITDANGCQATASGTITGPPTLALSITPVDDSCFQSRKGSAMANVTGGNPPYQYMWSNISSAQNNLSLGIGTYTVTVTDSKGCSITGSTSIGQAPPFTHTLTSTDIACAGTSTGSITITPSGGTPGAGYSFVWNPGTVSGGSPTSLAAGFYRVTVMDGNFCERQDSVMINELSTPLVVTTSSTDVTCNGANNGTITVNASGGTTPYSFLGNIVPPGTTTIPGLAPNTYAGNVTDANGCAVAVSETITEPGPQSLVLLSKTDNICNGGIIGAISVDFTNPTGSVTYDWNPGGVQPSSRTGLSGGVYDITATDQNTCSASLSVTVDEPAAPVMTVTVIDAACFGGNGNVTPNPVGGGPFTFNWSTGATTPTITPPAGSYTVSASDANSCNQTAAFSVDEAPEIFINATQTNLLCFNDADGTITLNPSGGTPGYTFVWGAPVTSITNTATQLTAGNYTATVTDQAGCPKDTLITLTQPLLPVTLVVSSENVSCFGFNDGSIHIAASGGTPPYTYTWNPNVSTIDSATGLAPNSYNIVVADNNNCVSPANVNITEPSQPLTLVTDSTNLTCFESANGTGTVTVSGGTPPYTYEWTQNVSTTNSASGLAAGVYVVTVMDNNACAENAGFNITQPALLTATETHTDINCFGETNGAVFITAAGGTTAYSYSWSPAVSSVDSAVNIGAGTYTVTVTDANSCSVTQTAVVSEPQELVIIPVAVNVLCNGGTNGSISTSPSGGVPSYSLVATDGTNTFNSTTGDFLNLTAGVYSITITDQNQCVETGTAEVTQPDALTTTTTAIPAVCFNTATGQLSVDPVGGTPNYDFTLSTGETNSTGDFTGLMAGSYQVVITDANGCVLTDAATITQPDTLLISVSPTPVEVKLGDALQLTTTTNHTGGMTYEWTPANGLSCSNCADPKFEGIISQRYVVEVTTLEGCKGEANFVVTVIPDYGIFIPNAFTPDATGENDTWKVYTPTNGIKQLQVAVFNRWGEKVFESNDINFEWDGKYRGDKVPSGVYVYTAKIVWLDNHSDAKYHGTVTVLH